MTLAELRAALEGARQRQADLHAAIGDAVPTDEQNQQWEKLDGEIDELRASIAAAEEVEARAQRVRDARGKFGGTNIKPAVTEDVRNLDPRTSSVRSLQDGLMREMEGAMASQDTREQQCFERLVRGMVRDHSGGNQEHLLRGTLHNLSVRATPTYARAWAKVVTGGAAALTQDEARSIVVGTATSGGYLVPTNLDPTVVLTNDGAVDLVRGLCAARGSVKNLLQGQGTTWNGITSAGVTGSWDAESSAVSDDSPAFATDGVSLVTARIFARASFQALNSISGIESELARLFRDEFEAMEAAAHISGTGGGTQPIGIVPALVAITACRIEVGTSMAIAVDDINGVNRGLPIRFRRNSTWLSAGKFVDKVQELGSQVGYSFSGSITDGYPERLKNRPLVVSDSFPEAMRTTAQDPTMILGDWGGYIIVDRPGSFAVEFIPQLFDPTTGTPVGERGWLCTWETGADVFNPAAFRVLVNKTSA